MSLEQALAANTEALNRVAVLLSSANQGAIISAAPTPIQQPAPQTYTPPVQQQAVPMAMPGGMPAAPFPGAGAPHPSATPAGLPPRPFNDALGLLDWAKKKYDTLGATPGYADKFGAVIQQHGLVNITDAQPNQFDSLYAAISALG